MSQRTESSEFAPGFLWRLSLLTILALGVVFGSEYVFSSPLSHIIPQGGWALFPWILAGGQTLRNALAAYSGTSPTASALVDGVRALSALLFAFVICPAVFLLGWRRRRLEKEPALDRRQLRASSVLYAFTCVVSLFVAISVVPISIASESARHSVRQYWPVAFSRNLIASELQLLALDIYQYRLVPRDVNGGGGSYRGYRLRDDLSRTENATYSFTVNENVVTIHVQSVAYPKGSIEVKVDSIGRLVWWKYGGFE